MYIVKPDGSILCETAKEALGLQAEILGKNKPAPREEEIHHEPQRPRKYATDDDLEFLRKLQAVSGKELDSDEIAPLIGADGAAGVGSKFGWAAKRLEKDGYRMKDYIRQRKNDDGRTRWNVIKGLAG